MISTQSYSDERVIGHPSVQWRSKQHQNTDCDGDQPQNTFFFLSSSDEEEEEHNTCPSATHHTNNSKFTVQNCVNTVPFVGLLGNGSHKQQGTHYNNMQQPQQPRIHSCPGGPTKAGFVCSSMFFTKGSKWAREQIADKSERERAKAEYWQAGGPQVRHYNFPHPQPSTSSHQAVIGSNGTSSQSSSSSSHRTTCPKEALSSLVHRSSPLVDGGFSLFASSSSSSSSPLVVDSDVCLALSPPVLDYWRRDIAALHRISLLITEASRYDWKACLQWLIDEVAECHHEEEMKRVRHVHKLYWTHVLEDSTTTFRTVVAVECRELQTQREEIQRFIATGFKEEPERQPCEEDELEWGEHAGESFNTFKPTSLISSEGGPRQLREDSSSSSTGKKSTTDALGLFEREVEQLNAGEEGLKGCTAEEVRRREKKAEYEAKKKAYLETPEYSFLFPPYTADGCQVSMDCSSDRESATTTTVPRDPLTQQVRQLQQQRLPDVSYLASSKSFVAEAAVIDKALQNVMTRLSQRCMWQAPVACFLAGKDGSGNDTSSPTTTVTEDGASTATASTSPQQRKRNNAKGTVDELRQEIQRRRRELLENIPKGSLFLSPSSPTKESTPKEPAHQPPTEEERQQQHTPKPPTDSGSPLAPRSPKLSFVKTTTLKDEDDPQRDDSPPLPHKPRKPLRIKLPTTPSSSELQPSSAQQQEQHPHPRHMRKRFPNSPPVLHLNVLLPQYHTTRDGGDASIL